jgi:hypothetical protein
LKVRNASVCQKSRLLAPKILPTASAGEKNEQRGDSKHDHTMSDKQRYLHLLEQIRELEIERAELISCSQPVPRRLNFHFAMLRADAEELRLWGHRGFVRAVRAIRGLARSEG